VFPKELVRDRIHSEKYTPKTHMKLIRITIWRLKQDNIRNIVLKT
jgi:hypothetical protein